ncbi:hypothetical protein Tco_1015974 [Tanacetum coccineum]|uniref:Uncharacterized protein n=1 Tax=Tanacetum coccineum TaxID=301880 RepID=A0ABQ5FMW1_9ASTR
MPNDVRRGKLLLRQTSSNVADESYTSSSYEFEVFDLFPFCLVNLDTNVESQTDGSKGEPSVRDLSTMVGSYWIIVMSSVIIFLEESLCFTRSSLIVDGQRRIAIVENLCAKFLLVMCLCDMWDRQGIFLLAWTGWNSDIEGRGLGELCTYDKMGVTQEPEKPVKVKGKDKIKYDADVAQGLHSELDEEARLEREREEEGSNDALIEEWDSFKARIDTDAQLAKRLQAEEREHISVEEQARLLMEFIASRKKFFATKRAEEKRNKPPTKVE